MSKLRSFLLFAGILAFLILVIAAKMEHMSLWLGLFHLEDQNPKGIGRLAPPFSLLTLTPMARSIYVTVFAGHHMSKWWRLSRFLWRFDVLKLNLASNCLSFSHTLCEILGGDFNFIMVSTYDIRGSLYDHRMRILLGANAMFGPHPTGLDGVFACRPRNHVFLTL